jgi:hypothetical protein
MQSFIQNVMIELPNIKNDDLLKFYNKVYLSAFYLFPSDVALILKNKNILNQIKNAEDKIKNIKTIKTYRFFYDLKTVQIEYLDNSINNHIIMPADILFKNYDLENDFESIICKGFITQKETFQLLNLAYYL